MKISNPQYCYVVKNKIALSVISILLLGLFGFQSKPTMKETIDFIIPKLTGRDVFCSGEIYLSDYNISYSFDYKSNTLIKTVKGEQFGKPVSLITYIALKKLNPENIKVSETPTCGNLIHINIDISTINNIEIYYVKKNMVTKTKELIKQIL
jgi:hypothetical protein